MMDRDDLLLLLGETPTKSALNPEILEEVDCSSFVRSKISYSVEPDERVSAYLSIPKDGAGPFPAVYCFH
jgi:hypothetical protein